MGSVLFNSIHTYGSVRAMMMETLYVNEDSIPICPKCGLEFETSSGAIQGKKLGNGRAMFHESFYCGLCDEMFEFECEDDALPDYVDNEGVPLDNDEEIDEPRDPITKPISMHLDLFGDAYYGKSR